MYQRNVQWDVKPHTFALHRPVHPGIILYIIKRRPDFLV
jgi:hypothetical protein